MTTKPNDFVAPIHNRMPVILSEETEALWLDPMTENVGTLEPILTPYPAELMGSYEVSSYVNAPRNEGREWIHPV